MPLSLYIMGRDHLMNRKCGNESLLRDIQNHDLFKTHFRRILNKSQYMALRESLTQPLTLIHGPPGTGKTKYALLPILKCAHLALQLQFDAMNRKNVANAMNRIKGGNVLTQMDRVWRVGRIGVFAGSNQAIDEIVLTILAWNRNNNDTTQNVYSDIAIARMGNTFNMDPNVAKHKDINVNNWIDYYLAFKWDKQTKREVYNWRHKFNQRVKAIQAELKQIEKDLSQVIATKGSQLSTDDKVWESVKALFLKSRPLSLELQCLKKVEGIRYPNQAQRKLLPLLMNECQVLFSTANYLGRCMNETVKMNKFDFCIFDECCQMRETETLIALQHCLRAVLIGDPKQLQATILYHGKYRNLLQNSLFIRIEKYMEPIMLTEQYRMNEEISLFPSHQFYDGELVNAVNVEKGERIKSFHGDKSGAFKPYLFFDVCGVEEKRANCNSFVNLSEIECIESIIHNFTKNEAYLAEIDSIGIITPYLAHKNLIDLKLCDTKRDLLQKHRIRIECVTVDEFQGAERDIILFSCVRSNNSNNIGFLNDVSRLNVAITRAKYALWIIGNADCLRSSDATWNALLQDASKRNLLIDKYFCEC